ncbi:MAG: S41 family peptidase [Thermoanaerobaculia bacterium]
MYLFFIFLFSLSLFSNEAKLVFHPDICGEKVVFVYEDDLWISNSLNGKAFRLTNHPGKENFPKFSKDCNQIAFLGSYDGIPEIYTIPSQGGVPKRVTYHPSQERVSGWSEDGKFIYFTASYEMDPKLYKVSIEGSYPEKIEIPKVSFASIDEKNNLIAYVPTNSSRMNWKGYKGGQQEDIYLFDGKNSKFEKIISWEGFDSFPMFYDGNIFFASDREDGRMNLYKYFLKDKKIERLTYEKEWDIEMPSLGGDKIVYVKEGSLWVYDIKENKNLKTNIELSLERWQMMEYYLDPSKYVHSGFPSKDGKKAVVEARGDLYLIDPEMEKAENLTETSNIREIHPALSPDDKLIAFFSDETGEYELYTMEAKKGGKKTQITKNSRTYYYEPKWSQKGGKIAFQDKDFNLYIADTEKNTYKKIDRFYYLKDNEIFWEWVDFSFSPDGRYLAYSVVEENMNSAIKIYDIKEDKVYRLTDGYFDDFSPSFDKKGFFLFFLSNRNFKPMLDPFMDNNVNVNTTCIMAFLLKDEGPEPFTKEFYNIYKDKKIENIEIDFRNPEKRIFKVPVKEGTYKNLQSIESGLLYLSKKDFGFPGMEEFFDPKGVSFYNLMKYDIEEENTETITENIGDFKISQDGKRALYRAKNEIGLLDIKENAKKEKISFYSLKQKINPQEEYFQIYRDVWRQIRDFFYDPNLHGRDWNKIYEKYKKLIPHVSTREDMNYIIGQLIGELCASHEYIVGRGGPKRIEIEKANMGLLGAEIGVDKKGFYFLKHIYNGRQDKEDLKNPLEAPGLNLKDGVYLLKIDGKEVSSKENLNKYLIEKAEKEVILTVNEKPSLEGARDVKVKTLSYLYGVQYYDWINKNRRLVEEKTGGRVGYMHLADMDEEGLSQFEEAFRALRYKDGLIIDVRSNGGGFVSWFIIDKLERKLKYLTQTRDFKAMRYPHGVHSGPIVVLIDEETGSDGEVFSQHIKDLGLATVIGTRTWGGLIGIINMLPLIDGGSVTQSNVGFANLKGEWVVENWGVVPDIEIEQTPERVIKGQDPQLEFGIDYILKKLKEKPLQELIPPPFPVK